MGMKRVEKSNVVQLSPSVTSWNNPDTSLIDGGGIPTPEFPGSILGEYWDRWTIELAASKNTPRDYVGASLLTVAAALIGNARTAAAGGWVEPALLWAVLVGNPSAAKSPAMDPFNEMIADLEQELVTETQEADDVEDSAEAAGTVIRLDDVTTQAAAEVAAQNEKGLILIKDELSGLLSRMGQSGGEPFWLKAYGARSETVRRKGKRPITVKNLSISMLGGAQPGTLRSFLDTTEHRGFAARWLYIFPRSSPGYKARRAVDLASALSALRRLRSLNLADGRPVQVPVARAAITKFERWVNSREQERHADQEGLWGQWIGKQGGLALRIALVLEHLWWAHEAPATDVEGPKQISGAALGNAMQFLNTYAAPMAAITFNNASRPQSERDALQLIRLIRTRRGEDTFNARLLGRGSHGPAGRLAEPKAMAAACEILVAASLIRLVGVRADGRRGRAPSDFQINPALRG